MQRNFIANGKIGRFVALPAAEQWLLLRAALVVACVRGALWRFPFRRVCAWAGGEPHKQRRLEGQSVERMAWAVQVVSQRIPRASCLTQALALQWLLRRAGQGSALRIGVAKDAEHGFEAHAWLEHQGLVLLGQPEDEDRFVPILASPAEQP
jgi:hypothetical protein